MKIIYGTGAGDSANEKQRRELEALTAMPDREIDTSDIPELPEGAFKNAVRGGSIGR